MHSVIIKIKKKKEIKYEGSYELIENIVVNASKQFEDGEEFINFRFAVVDKKLIEYFYMV